MKTLDSYGDFRKYMVLKFNPLSTKILENADILKKTRYLDALAASLVTKAKASEPDHWTERARTILKGFLDVVLSKNISILNKISNTYIEASVGYISPNTKKIVKLDDIEDGAYIKSLDGKYLEKTGKKLKNITPRKELST